MPKIALKVSFYIFSCLLRKYFNPAAKGCLLALGWLWRPRPLKEEGCGLFSVVIVTTLSVFTDYQINSWNCAYLFYQGFLLSMSLLLSLLASVRSTYLIVLKEMMHTEVSTCPEPCICICHLWTCYWFHDLSFWVHFTWI